MIHASLKSIGWIENGPEVIFKVLNDVLGATGNIIMLTASRQFSTEKYFDVATTPGDVGLLSEAFRKLQGVQRSCNPMVSIAAYGPDKDRYLKRYDAFLDEHSPFQALLASNAKIMMFGADYNKCTVYHLSEERTKSKFHFYKTFSGKIRCHDGVLQNASQTYFVRKSMSQKKDARPVGYDFEKTHLVSKAKLGSGIVRIFDANQFDQYCTKRLIKDPKVFQPEQ